LNKVIIRIQVLVWDTIQSANRLLTQHTSRESNLGTICCLNLHEDTALMWRKIF